MSEAGLLDLSNEAGLFATLVLSFNFLLGILLSVQYKKLKCWEKMPMRVKKTDINRLHNYTAYIALSLALVHPLLLFGVKSAKFKWIDMVFPIHSPHQPWMVALGTLALYALLTVIISTQKAVKKRLTFRAWKNIHLISYLTALLFIIHGIMMDPHLQDGPVDFLDGEKLISEGCGLVLLLASVLRFRYHLQKNKAVF